MWRRPSSLLAALAPAALVLACAAPPGAVPDAPGRGLRVMSTPADGATVRSPVDELRLRFNPPARLIELTVTGSDGLTSPMMITAVDDAADYVLPLPGLGAGSYRVAWRATVAGRAQAGAFGFTVR